MSKRILFSCIILVLLLPALVNAGITGKVRGKVVDKETGDPLPGTNVLIEGTTMGAATDLDGVYIILNVPVGTYTVRASFVGYQNVKISNVRVTMDLTTDVNFELPLEAIVGEIVEIMAERPLVSKNATNYIRVMRSEDLETMPVRGVAAVVARQAGAVDDGANLHIRGGRSHENARYVDGVFTTSIRSGDEALTVVDRAIEEISYQAGGMTAEYGFANSGVVNTVTKTGGRDYHFSLEAVSDDIFSVYDEEKGHRILGIDKLYSYGYDNYYLTAGGPVPMLKNVRFYVAGQQLYRKSAATWFEGWQQDSLAVTRSWNLDQGKPWASTVTDTLQLYADIPPGRLPSGADKGYNLTGNIIWDHQPFRLKIGGSYYFRRNLGNATGDPEMLLTTDQRRARFEHNDYTGYAQLTHAVNPTMFYTLNLNYFFSGYQRGDNVWWDDIRSASDPLFNDCFVDTGVTKTYMHPIGINHNAPNDVYNTFEKRSESYMGLKLDLTKQFGKQHEVKTGGEFNYYTLRRYQISTTGMLQAFRTQGTQVGTINEISDYTAYRSFLRNYGYDIYGNKIDESRTYKVNVAGEMLDFDGRDAPPHPIFAGYYLQDKIELNDLVLNAGVRLDYYKTGSDQLKNIRDIGVASTGFIDEESIVEGKAYTYVSPRLSCSFPVTDRTVFHAQFGKFVQLTRLQDVFESWGYFSHALFSGGYARQYPNPNLKPERQTQYEFGFAQQFGDNASLDITAFYKDTQDQIAMRTVIPVEGAPYEAPWINMNDDFSTVKGISVDFRLRRMMRISAQANYTLSFSSGTGSQSGSSFNIAWAEDDPHFPQVIMPLDFDQRHRGTVNVDVRFQDEDGPTLLGGYPLGNVGLSAMFYFHSGSPFTRVVRGDAFSEVFGYTMATPLESWNQSSMPWVYQLNTQLDKTFSIGGLDLNVYLWAINLLNTKSATNVFRQTGTPGSDGHTETADGKQRAENYDAKYGEGEYQRWYQALLTNSGTWGYQAPRQVRLGLKIML